MFVNLRRNAYCVLRSPACSPACSPAHIRLRTMGTMVRSACRSASRCTCRPASQSLCRLASLFIAMVEIDDALGYELDTDMNWLITLVSLPMIFGMYFGM